MAAAPALPAGAACHPVPHWSHPASPIPVPRSSLDRPPASNPLHFSPQSVLQE